MRRIEQALSNDGRENPCAWDGIGARTLWYAYAISLPEGRFNRTDDPLIDVRMVRSYASGKDRLWGWMLIVSTLSFGLISIAGWLIWGD